MKKTYLLLIGLCFAFLMPSVQAGSAGNGLVPMTATESATAPEMDKKELRKQFRQLRKKIKRGEELTADDDQIVEIICALLIPPLGVYLYEDEITTKFWIALILMFLFPLGSIYALLVVLDVI